MNVCTMYVCTVYVCTVYVCTMYVCTVHVCALCMCCKLDKKFVYKLKLLLSHFIVLVCIELQKYEIYKLNCVPLQEQTHSPPPLPLPHLFSFLPHLTLFVLMSGLKCGLSHRCVAGVDQYSVCQQLITLLVILCGVLLMWLHWSCAHAPVLDLFPAQHWTNLRVKLWI